MARPPPHPSLALFNPAVQSWFESVFSTPTSAQAQAWPAIAHGDSTLLLAPTGSGKTLAAFLQCLDRLMFRPAPPPAERCRVLYISPLKALAVDVERNLRAPLAGITQWATQRGDAFVVPEIAVRTGDTPQSERARFGRAPSDILITTPESLYLLLTSNARSSLRFVDTVILDEIHALVPTKRGAHLAVSLERLQALTQKPLQRIGLSATQRPLEEVARFLGGAEPSLPHGSTPAAAGADVDTQLGTGEAVRYRPVTLINAGERKSLQLRVEVPVEDMAQLSQPIAVPSGAASQGESRPSIWSALHPRLLELVKEHTSTLIFVNSRRVAERLAGALNELAGEVLVHAHHGSIARAQRSEIEDALKAGRVKGLVATSSLELGIDMGSIDLVVQIEAPPSVASGLQRIGRAGHQVGGQSEGIIFPKFRADLVACAALTRAMRDGEVERSHYPRNPLDILAQHIVAMVGMDNWNTDTLFATLRSSAPFADLRRTQFEGVLDLLSGRYETEEFSDLRPRIVWDRVKNELSARDGARRVAVVNGGTIPDRGLYGVFLVGAERKGARVGELDEEMVFESRVGETFILGASTWRIEEITHDRVLVSPAPGQPGKMPFWRGDAAGRPLEVGQRIGKLVRELRAVPVGAAIDRLTRLHDLDARAAENVMQYLKDQADVTEEVPDDRTLVIERMRDELGDWKVCVLSPLGGQVHAPWSMAIVAKIQAEMGIEAEALWANEGFVLRFPDTDAPPDVALLLPSAEEVEGWVMAGLSGSSLLAAKFRENAARALLLPRRRPGMRTPLWKMRRRSADLLKVASQYPSFPMLLETYRECLRDLFDLPALRSVLRDVQTKEIKVHTVDTRTPSPFASTLLFGYVANYLYEGDAPLAERRVQALAIDQTQLRELLGEAELRELLDADVLEELEQELQGLAPGYKARSRDGVHDLLRRLGDLTWDQLLARCETLAIAEEVHALVRARRVVHYPSSHPSPGHNQRFLAVEDIARYRDGLGIPAPPGIPEALLQPVADPRSDLVLRYARTHGPFTVDELAARYHVPRGALDSSVRRLVASGRLLEGAFRPRGVSQELCESEVLRSVRRRSLAKLRREVEPVPPATLGRFVARWQGVMPRRKGLDALLDAVEKLQGFPLPASLLESEILPARVEGYTPSDLDALMAAGELVWTGVEPLGEHDGRVMLFLSDALPRLWAGPAEGAPALSERAERVLASLNQGANFFPALHAAAGAGLISDSVEAIWELVWSGRITNDSLRPLRAFARAQGRGQGRSRRPGVPNRSFRSRRAMPPSAEGRWSRIEERAQPTPTPTERATALAQQLLVRHGLVTREVAAVENVPGGFSSVYAVLRGLEEGGRARRGYFVTGVGAAQFALPAALELLRSFRAPMDQPERLALSAVDPANPYGALLAWPPLPEGVARGPSRAVGAYVVLVNGALTASLGRGGRQLWTYLPTEEPERSSVARATAEALADLVRRPEARSEGLLIEEINGGATLDHPMTPFLRDAGFTLSLRGLHLRRRPFEVVSPAESLMQDSIEPDGDREGEQDDA